MPGLLLDRVTDEVVRSLLWETDKPEPALGPSRIANDAFGPGSGVPFQVHKCAVSVTVQPEIALTSAVWGVKEILVAIEGWGSGELGANVGVEKAAVDVAGG